MMKNIFYTILGDNFIDEIMYAGSDLDRNAWELGDKVLLIHQMIQSQKSSIITSPGLYPVDVENRILAIGYSAIVVFVADVSGLAQVTIRRFADLSSAFNPTIRAKHKILPMSHFEWALQYPPYIEDILMVDLKLVDKNGGKPLPLRVMQAIFRSIDKIPEMLDQINALDEMENILALAEFDQTSGGGDNEKDKIPPLVFHFLNNYPRIAEYIINAVDRWPIPDNMKSEIVSAVNHLYSLIGDSKEIMDDIDKEVKVR